MSTGKICVSVYAATADEMIDKVRRASELADVVEVRFDYLRQNQIEPFFALIAASDIVTPLIATFRSQEQGGHSTASPTERAAFWQNARDGFWGADVEEEVAVAAGSWINRIVSFHDFNGIPDGFSTDIDRLFAVNAQIVKVAARADDITDSIPVWKLLEKATEFKQVIPIAMGEAGQWTRVLGLAHGAFMTYASLDESTKTAPGQISAQDLTGVYRVRDLDRSTTVFGVLGDPISQSLSPYMHNPGFAAAGINAVFIPLLVKDLDEFIGRMVRAGTREVELNFGGLSVTMPHKQSIMKHLDAIEPSAEKIGAVNTIKIDDGKLTGYNTDAQGFIEPLRKRYGDLRDARVAVFGAGGAARACVFALTQDNADVTVFARDAEKAEAFSNEFGVKAASIAGATVGGFDVVVDSTPLGMRGPFENDSLLTSEQLKGVKFVYDLVTKPTDTPIIREAKRAGVPAIGGLDMLVAQGAKQFEIWTGVEAPVGEMRAAVTERIRDIKQ